MMKYMDLDIPYLTFDIQTVDFVYGTALVESLPYFGCGYAALRDCRITEHEAGEGAWHQGCEASCEKGFHLTGDSVLNARRRLSPLRPNSERFVGSDFLHITTAVLTRWEIDLVSQWCRISDVSTPWFKPGPPIPSREPS